MKIREIRGGLTKHGTTFDLKYQNLKKMTMKKLFFALMLAATPFILKGQVNPQLAEQYFQNGEYEKAVSLYEKLNQQNSGDYYFERYVACLMELNRFDEAEKTVSKQIKKEPQRSPLYVTLGKVYERQNKQDAADEQYKKGIERLPADQRQVVALHLHGGRSAAMIGEDLQMASGTVRMRLHRGLKALAAIIRGGGRAA